jgi:glutamyl/glutaminyl-tRNA synthetase
MANIGKLRERLGQLDAANFTAAGLETEFKTLAAATGQKVGALIHPARLAVSGRPVGPSLYHLLEVLGPDRVLSRLDRAEKW